MFHRARGLLAALLILPLAACGNDSTGPRTLDADDVSGVYRLCSLRFEAAGLRPIDIRAAAIDTMPANSLLRPPNLQIRRENRSFTLEFTPRGETGGDLRFDGTYTLGRNTVTLDFPEAAATQLRSRLLLPDPLQLQFQQSPQALTVVSTPGSVAIAKADYVRLAQIPPAEATNITDPVRGTLSGRFSIASCS